MQRKLTDAELKAGFDIPPARLTAREYANTIYWQIERHVNSSLYLGAMMIVFSSVDFMSGTEKDKKFAKWIDTYLPEYIEQVGNYHERNGVTRLDSEHFWKLRCAMFHETSGTDFGFHAGLYENLVFITNRDDVQIKSLIDAPAFIKAFYTGLYRWVDDVEQGKAEYQSFVYPFAVILQDVNPKTDPANG